MKSVTALMPVMIFFTATPISSVAAEPAVTVLTVEQAVQQAVASNPELKFYEAEIQAAKGDEEASALLDNPELETTIGRKSDAEREGTAWSVSVVQSFEFPGRLSLKKAIATRQVKLAELGLDRFKAALAAKVRESAYRLLGSQQLAEAARSVSARGQELVRVLVQRDHAGVTPLLETRVIEASVIGLRKKAIDAAQEAQIALFELNQLSGNSLNHSIKIAPCKLELREAPAEEELVAAALESNFELRIKIEELRAQGFRVELARNERYPAFKIGPFFSEEHASEPERMAGLGISVPLPLWNQNKGAIDAARARESQAKTALLLVQREVERTVREHALAYKSKLDEIRRWRPNVTVELREAAELGDRHYRLGAIPVSTYIELQSQYLEGLEAILSVQSGALEALQALEVTSGKKLRDVQCAADGEGR